MVSLTPPGHGPVDASRSPYARWRPLGFKDVTLNQGFWADKRIISRTKSLRHAFSMLDKADNLNNLRLAAGVGEGAYSGRNFLDSDVYKWLEAVAWTLGTEIDPDLQAMADQAIGLVAAAQQPDGYLNSYYTVAEPEARWADLDHGHEMYCAGHLFQAAVAWQRAVGDRRLLDVSCRFADHIDSVFGPEKRHGACGHPEIEVALIELYRVTGEKRYLDLSRFFIDQRGRRKMRGLGPYGPEYHQDHLPIRQVKEATGHTVRQLYLAAGVVDLYLETGEQALLDVMQLMWHDIASTKLYITGGIGARFDGEAFGDPYELPSDQCYCEACTSIANLMWNWRMLIVTGESRFADMIERSLYNMILASPALDGQHFFYVNPLMLRGARFLRLSSNPPLENFVPTERPQWHEVSCCPPNVMRTLASLGHYLATQDEGGIQIHQYAPAELAGELPGSRNIGLKMSTEYPWHGNIALEIIQSDAAPWALSLRLPGWARDSAIAINGQPVDGPKVEKGYIVLDRAWKAGDKVELKLAMEPELIASNPRIDATRASLAIQRGPIVYCLEDCDQELQGRLLDVEIDQSQPPKAIWREDLLGGVMVVEAAGRFVEPGEWQGNLYLPAASLGQPEAKQVRLVAVPYYAWGNRGISGMRVWIPAA